MQGPVNKAERHLSSELAEYVFRQFPAVLFTTFVLSGLVVLVLWGLFPEEILLSWLTSLCAVSALRLILYRWYQRRSETQFTPRQWLHLYSAGALISGFIWGVAPILFYSETSPQTNVFLAFVIGGLISGASSSMAPLKSTMQVFTAMVCLPIATLFLVHGSNLNLAMGTMMLIYGGAYLFVSANTARMIIESLMLQSENLREIDERKKAETQLRNIQQDLEKTVAQRTAELRNANDELSREIDERLQAEAKLSVSEERYRSLVESSSDWIWEINRDGTYTYSSPSVLAVLGYAPEEVLGHKIFDFMPEDEAERTKTLFDSNKSLGKPFARVVSRFLHKDGTERILETNGEPIFNDEGRLAGYRGIDRDITLRMKREEEQRKVEHLESLGLLAGGIAHDFNNLLMAIFGSIELARIKISANSAAARSLENALEAMEQARKLSGQLLTFSKGGSPNMEVTSIRNLIYDSCRLPFSGTAVKCEYNIPQDLWMTDIDPGQIWQVLNNILINAREAMGGGGTVWLSAENVTVDETSPNTLPPGHYVEVSVRDQGIGVSKKDIPRVFDPYFSTKVRDSKKGTGIGLAICHSIIEKHGGRIYLESELGRGTTVTFFLPALGEEELPAGRPERKPRSKGVSVLMLEDDSAVIKTTTQMLEYLGHCVTAVQDGAEVLDLYSHSQEVGNRYEVLLLDLTIRGGMGGRETLEKLKHVDPDVVAVVTSGYADDPVIAEFGQFGFKAALIKPFSIDTLGETIAHVAPKSGDEHLPETADKRDEGAESSQSG